MTARGDDHTINAISGRRATRDHLTQLWERGAYRAVAAAAGVQPTTVHVIISGRHTTAAVTAAAPLAAGSAGPRRVHAGGTRLRLRALHVMGHGSARIARAAGASEQAIQKLTRGQTATVRPALRDAIAALYDAWWDKRAPDTHPRASGPPPPPPAAAPSPATGAPPRPWTTTSSTSPATSPPGAGYPPPELAPPPTFICPHQTHRQGSHDHQTRQRDDRRPGP